MLSQTVEYALRAIVFLADRNPETTTTQQIAEVTRVPTAYLSKVLQSLSRGGLVRSQRGVRGGFKLTKDPDDFTILEVVNAVDPIGRIRECPLGLSSHGTQLCPLHRRLDNALKMMEDAFQETTLADVLSEPTPSVPLCNFPPQKQLTQLE